MSQNALRNQHADGVSRFERLRHSAVAQISELLQLNDVSLGVPIESRVKTWSSIEEKIQRKELELKDVQDLHDLVGIRIILLFRSDLEKVVRLIADTFEIVSTEDAGQRLGDSEFGYQSQHIVAKIPKAWLLVPSFSSLDDLYLEFQVRTLAQHIWAAVSHKLQYKNQESVPPPIRRAINRASALLETVDLEFERVLDARRHYVETTLKKSEASAPLNVDSLALVLSDELPEGNKKEDEPYSDLLYDLSELSITTAPQLRNLLQKHKEYVLKRESEAVAKKLAEPSAQGSALARLERGVFLTHVGLVRTALRKEFGSVKVDQILESRKLSKVADKKATRKKPNASK